MELTLPVVTIKSRIASREVPEHLTACAEGMANSLFITECVEAFNTGGPDLYDKVLAVGFSVTWFNTNLSGTGALWSARISYGAPEQLRSQWLHWPVCR